MARWIAAGLAAFAFGLPACAGAQPIGYRLVFHDDFDSLSLRSGGPSMEGLNKGTGVWTPQNEEGFGYEWFVTENPAKFSPFSVENSILTISAGPMPRSSAASYPAQTRGRPTHFGGAISTFNSFAIAPPFYVEARMKLSDNPAAWAAFWTLGIDKGIGPPSNRYVKQWEDDVIESFGNAKTYFASIHWNDRTSSPNVTAPYMQRTFGIGTNLDLADRFNRFGSLVTKTETVWYLNGQEVARIAHPAGSDANQPQFLILDLAYGFPWEKAAVYPEQTASIAIDYVRVYAPSKP
ncbi:glycoside hydrolase family 16 protein [Acidisoma cellulosilytica]|uniref:Glycoside hydrolase family 16 protein n=1 Tax=Acidisoma cellulosilyticum TaxID=2802395 RepID=A0A963Z3M4_9PROT|nr:glycoside hydrolase family 16 protein [Acidisoma cellulosilyticum]MCB8882199.1 glycoside hydrolase family 16 protein [Acidisoma cellulosilyticum]